MPFALIRKGKNKGKFKSPSGRVYTKRQVKAYYATGGWARPVNKMRRTTRKRRSRKKR